MLRTLPLGRSDFSALRARGDIFVDKTALIHQLAAFDDKVFLARPHGFGKSLLTSAFASLFADGLKCFRGLAIEQSWSDRTYPVARLDFSMLTGFQTAEAFRSRFHDYLVSAFSAIGFHFENDSLGLMAQLSSWFSSLPPASIVILIDDYDAPLINTLDNPECLRKCRLS